MKEPEKSDDFIEIEVEDLKIFLEKTLWEKSGEKGMVIFKVPNRGEFNLLFK